MVSVTHNAKQSTSKINAEYGGSMNQCGKRNCNTPSDGQLRGKNITFLDKTKEMIDNTRRATFFSFYPLAIINLLYRMVASDRSNSLYL